jgi:hypothetical protein
MPDENPDKLWDEYDWERFLQEQERRTEKYMGLIEKYMDHPDRDQIIAREMGWKIGSADDSCDWEEEVESSFDEEPAEESAQEPPCFGFEKHPLYREAIAFSAELDEVFANSGQKLREHATVVSLRDGVTLTAAKLAAALNDEDSEELGMSIAYLKRALRVLNSMLDDSLELHEEALIEVAQLELLRSRIFSIRDGIVSAMGEFRSEFRRRHGGR